MVIEFKWKTSLMKLVSIVHRNKIEEFPHLKTKQFILQGAFKLT